MKETPSQYLGFTELEDVVGNWWFGGALHTTARGQLSVNLYRGATRATLL